MNNVGLWFFALMTFKISFIFLFQVFLIWQVPSSCLLLHLGEVLKSVSSSYKSPIVKKESKCLTVLFIDKYLLLIELKLKCKSFDELLINVHILSLTINCTSGWGSSSKVLGSLKSLIHWCFIHVHSNRVVGTIRVPFMGQRDLSLCSEWL